MTDFLTRFSCLLDVGTAANATRAFDIYTTLMAETSLEDPPGRAVPALPFARIRIGSPVAARSWQR